MSRIRAWFLSRAVREQRLLLLMVALAILTIMWAGIVRPIGDGLSSVRGRHADAVQRLGDTQARVEALRAVQRHRDAPVTGTLADAVRARADAAGFVLGSLDPQGADGVLLTIPSAKPAALTAWLARLEASGILVEAAALTDNGDRTVHATLTLKARGS